MNDVEEQIREYTNRYLTGPEPLVAVGPVGGEPPASGRRNRTAFWMSVAALLVLVVAGTLVAHSHLGAPSPVVHRTASGSGVADGVRLTETVTLRSGSSVSAQVDLDLVNTTSRSLTWFRGCPTDSEVYVADPRLAPSSFSPPLTAQQRAFLNALDTGSADGTATALSPVRGYPVGQACTSSVTLDPHQTVMLNYAWDGTIAGVSDRGSTLQFVAAPIFTDGTAPTASVSIDVPGSAHVDTKNAAASAPAAALAALRSSTLRDYLDSLPSNGAWSVNLARDGDGWTLTFSSGPGATSSSTSYSVSKDGQVTKR